MQYRNATGICHAEQVLVAAVCEATVSEKWGKTPITADLLPQKKVSVVVLGIGTQVGPHVLIIGRDPHLVFFGTEVAERVLIRILVQPRAIIASPCSVTVADIPAPVPGRILLSPSHPSHIPCLKNYD